VPKVIAELLGWLLLALPDVAAVDHHVMSIRNAINADGTEGKGFYVHCAPPPVFGGQDLTETCTEVCKNRW
jgi:hypothetical protein